MSAPAPKQSLAERAMAARSGGVDAPYLAVLNPEQRLAVETLDGPVLVLAGAGTGKTRVLTTRIAHILASRRAFPSEILAVTFTNKAAREMKERIGQLVGEAVEGMPWLGTFHATGVKLLRRHAELVDLKPGFTILDTDDQIRLLKQLIQAEGVDEKRWPARILAGAIDGWKNRALTPDKVPAGEGGAYANGLGVKLYKDYQDRLKTLNAVDFGDLLLEAIRLLRDNPAVLAEYQRKFKYILVDEYQDTNVAQYLWLRLLAQKLPDRPQNICCVGDDDQSIYGWRGAEVDNILRFDKDFPGAQVIRLERNYRSTGHILAAAAHLIAHNEGRLGKTLFTDGEDGEKPTLTSLWDSEEEARTIGERCEDGQRRGEALNDMAILVRASFQMREFEERFITIGLPYRVIGGPRFYERAEIRDALAYLRIIAQPADDLAFERIVNQPKRGLGEATIQILHDHARRDGVPLLHAARLIVETDELKPKARGALREFVQNVDLWAGDIDKVPHQDLAERVLDESGYTEMWRKERTAEAQGRLDNLKELVRSMQEFENLLGFLEHVSLVTEARGEGESEDAVSIMTLHSAKGLEFDTVFLPGWEEGVFPNQRALDENGRAGLEEERRLAYVGVTRARRHAHITFAGNRRIHGLWQSTVPSRFINELPEDHVTLAENAGGQAYQNRFDRVETFSSGYATPGWQRAQAQKALADAAGRFTGRTGSQAFGSTWAEGRGGFQGRLTDRSGPGRTIEGDLIAKSTGEPSRFKVGDRVFHLKFGYGDVTAADGNKLTVEFDKAGEKKVVDSFVEAVK